MIDSGALSVVAECDGKVVLGRMSRFRCLGIWGLLPSVIKGVDVGCERLAVRVRTIARPATRHRGDSGPRPPTPDTALM
jgi:hypothetical protein